MSPASTHSDPRTPPGAPIPGTGKAPSASLPAPHPGFVALLGIHLRSLVQEFPVAWILFGGLAVGLPLASAFTVLDPSNTELTFGLTPLLSGLFALQFSVQDRCARPHPMTRTRSWQGWAPSAPTGRTGTTVPED